MFEHYTMRITSQSTSYFQSWDKLKKETSEAPSFGNFVFHSSNKKLTRKVFYVNYKCNLDPQVINYVIAHNNDKKVRGNK